MREKSARGAQGERARGGGPRRFERLGIACALAVLLSLAGACESTSIQALRGARLYASGSDALERGEVAVAIDDLERASHLVPHASEIQNHLGLAYWAHGDVSSARASFDRAIELDCENEAAVRNRAELIRAQSSGDGNLDPVRAGGVVESGGK